MKKFGKIQGKADKEGRQNRGVNCENVKNNQESKDRIIEEDEKTTSENRKTRVKRASTH